MKTLAFGCEGAKRRIDADDIGNCKSDQ